MIPVCGKFFKGIFGERERLIGSEEGVNKREREMGRESPRDREREHREAKRKSKK
jgi:hypothetical protein